MWLGVRCKWKVTRHLVCNHARQHNARHLVDGANVQIHDGGNLNEGWGWGWGDGGGGGDLGERRLFEEAVREGGGWEGQVSEAGAGGRRGEGGEGGGEGTILGGRG